MSTLGFLDIGQDVEGQNEDYLPQGFGFPTGVFPMTVELAYLSQSRKKATCVNVHFKEVGGNRTHREAFYVTSGEDKGKKNYYIGKDKKKRLLPGMEAMNQLSIILTGKPLAAHNPEVKTVNLYDFDARKELPQDVPVLTDFLGGNVLVGILSCKENKRTNIGTAEAPDWKDSNEPREFNEVAKFFYSDSLTVAEKEAGATAEFRDEWEEKYPPDFVRDRFKPTGATKQEASAAQAAATEGKVKGLFDDDDAPEAAEAQTDEAAPEAPAAE